MIRPVFFYCAKIYNKKNKLYIVYIMFKIYKIKNKLYDLKETHHYDHHNTFWDRARQPQQNNNSQHCLKQFYVIIV
jgi:hypothetical protein